MKWHGLTQNELDARVTQDSAFIIHRVSQKQWVFSIEDATVKGQRLVLRTRRGACRVWSDPRLMTDWLIARYGLAEALVELETSDLSDFLDDV